MKNVLRALIVPSVAALTVAACGADDNSSDSSADAEAVPAAEIDIADAWVREPAAGQTTAAGYGVVTNDTDETITLIGASAPITGTFEVHEVLMADDGTMSMQEKDGGYEIAPGESLTLEPGGAHIMMLGIDPDEFTEAVDLTFVFDTDQVTVPAELRVLDAMGDMDDMEMDDS